MLSDTMSNEIRLFRNTTDQLDKIQNNLFVIGSCLSYDQLGKIKLELQKISQEDIQQLEDWIDQMDSELPELKNFIIPGGDVIISNAHICRTISRRAERRCVPAQNHPLIQIYLNRLSDYFFVVARYATKQLGYKDKIWAS